MISLATMGFIVGGILFALYAYSVKSYVSSSAISHFYPWAYYLLAITFFVWGIAAATGNQIFLNASVLIGNALILAGSVLLLKTIVHKKSIAAVAAIIAILLFLGRLLHFPPTPYMQEGILIFNTNIWISILYAALFIGIWLPANLSVGKIIGSRGKVPEFTKLLQGLFGLSIFAAIFMPLAHVPAVAAGAFVTLALCYVVLISANMLLKQ